MIFVYNRESNLVIVGYDLSKYMRFIYNILLENDIIYNILLVNDIF